MKVSSMGKNKYGAIRVQEDGISFASKLENRRYRELKLLQQSGEIEGLQVHPKFKAIVKGTLVCTIILDFQYWDKKTNALVYEDTKGTVPPISRLKFKLLKALFPEVDVRLIFDAR
jgi:hypothetical protein